MHIAMIKCRVLLCTTPARGAISLLASVCIAHSQTSPDATLHLRHHGHRAVANKTAAPPPPSTIALMNEVRFINAMTRLDAGAGDLPSPYRSE